MAGKIFLSLSGLVAVASRYWFRASYVIGYDCTTAEGYYPMIEEAIYRLCIAFTFQKPWLSPSGLKFHGSIKHRAKLFRPVSITALVQTT